MSKAKKEYRNKFLDDTKYPTCLAPWHAITIKWGGAVVPDIIYKQKLGNINDQTLKEIWYGKKAKELRKMHRSRDVPEYCIGCQKKEQSGRSRRMFFWDKMDYDLRIESEWHDWDMEPDIRYLDFTLSNKCNLACIHCGPFVSTGWSKLGKKLNKEMPEVKMIMQVHDELIFETPKKNSEEVLSIIKNMMEKAVELDIPLIVEAAIGTNWNEAH